MTHARLICVLGPPAVGKTTLTGRLTCDLDANVLRPRDVIRDAIAHCPAARELFETDDAGRVPDESLGLALRMAARRMQRTTILENLPWTPPQLADLATCAAGALMILHLRAPDDLLAQRRRSRTYCPACYPLPAQTAKAGMCGRCGSALAHRNDDDVTAFAERLNLHYTLMRGIISFAHRIDVPVASLDASQEPDGIARDAMLAIQTMNGAG
jgi:adenylate kinase